MNKPINIIVVEDSEDDFILLKRFLEKSELVFSAVRIDSPEVFTEELETGNYDLIICDYALPKFSGLDALKIFKKTGLEMPFLIVSGTIGEDIAVETMRLGANDYLMKDNLERLIPAIKRELEESKIKLAKKNAEASLAESEERFRLLAENAFMMVIEMNRKTEIVFANRAVYFTLGYEMNEIIGKDPFSLVYEEDLQAVAKKFNDVKEGLKPETNSYRIRHKNGNYRWINIIGNRYFTSSGELRFVIIGDDITERVNVEAILTKSQDDLRNLTKKMIDVREDERAEMAKVVHDDLGQSLTALKMDISWLNRKINDSIPSVKNKIIDMLNLVDETMNTVRRIASDLRPGILDDLGLSAAIDWQLEEFYKRSEIKTYLNIEPDEINLNEELNVSLYRIFQEAITNVARHAKASKVWITLKKSENSVFLAIKDNGVGINKDQIDDKRSLGLLGIKERLLSLNGQFEISGNTNQGTEIKIEVPL